MGASRGLPRLVGGQFRDSERDVRIGEFVLDRLERRDRSAELGPVLCVLQCDVQSLGHLAEHFLRQ
jgi:hypothetical protein